MTPEPGHRRFVPVAAIGADPEALEDLVVGLRRAAVQLRDIAGGTDRRLRAGHWEGPDAARFRRDWDLRHGAALRSTAASCTALARGVQDDATQQRQASAGRSAGHRGTAFPALPRSTQVYSGSVEATVGFLAGTLTGVVTVEHLAGGRRRVSYTTAVAGGGAGGAGASAGGTVDGAPAAGVGSSASATAQLRATETRTWTVEAGHLPLLLAGLAAESTPLGLPFRAADGIGQGIDDALGLLGIDTPLGDDSSMPLVPAPDRTEHLAGIAIGGSVTGLAGGVGGSASVRESLSVGTASGPNGKALVLQVDGGGSAGLTRRLAGVLGVGSSLPGAADLQARVEVPVGPGRHDPPRTALVTLTGTTGRDRVIVRAAVDLRAAGPAGARLAAALDELAHGRPGAAAEALAGGTAPPMPHPSVTVSVARATVGTSSWSAPVVGTGGSFTPTGSVQEVTVRE